MRPCAPVRSVNDTVNVVAFVSEIRQHAIAPAHSAVLAILEWEKRVRLCSRGAATKAIGEPLSLSEVGDKRADASRHMWGGEVQSVDIGIGSRDIGQNLDKSAAAQQRFDVPRRAHDQAVPFDTPSGDDVSVVGRQFPSTRIAVSSLSVPKPHRA
jgi:hypothetical protein